MSSSSHFEQLEAQFGLIPQAAKSAECTLITGVPAGTAYERVYNTPDGKGKLQGRTPLSLDRDRILYSDSFRRQDDKHHVLFFGKTRRARNYTSHTLKASHVARVVAGRLGLNTDLAEAIILGSKVGGVPFLHEGKKTVSTWLEQTLKNLDDKSPPPIPPASGRSRGKSDVDTQLDIPDSGDHGIADLRQPLWLDRLNSEELRRSIRSNLPVADGTVFEPPYSSGGESYWLLATNPFTLTARSQSSDTAYTAQTMYGIWRHSLPEPNALPARFRHQITLLDNVTYEFDDSHATYEAMVARYCDDITWAIENVAEAARVEFADEAPHSRSAYGRLGRYPSQKKEPLAPEILQAVLDEDPGKFYSYFIDDLVTSSARRLEEVGDAKRSEELIQRGISLSELADSTLSTMLSFLDDEVFSNPAISFRNKAVGALTTTALDILFLLENDSLMSRVERLGRVEGWLNGELADEFKQRAQDDVCRAAACVSLLASMSDREVFDLVGLDRE